MKIVTAEQMMRIDRECIESGTPSSVLMENAGKAVADRIREVAGDVAGKQVIILAGPGNNGGDGLVVARYLHDWEADVRLFVFGKKRENDRNLELVKKRNILLEEITGENLPLHFQKNIQSADIFVDGLFGTGNNRPISGVYKQALESAAESLKKRTKKFAVDMPSGLNADTGETDEACLSFDDTVTFACPKVGLYLYPGSEKAGRITVADIGIPESLSADILLELNSAERISRLLPRRPLVSNKGTFGKVLVVAGSVNYIGAAYLACSGAVRSGAGLVTLATAGSLVPVLASKMAETTYIPLPETEFGIISPEAVDTVISELARYDVVLIGCGLGQTPPVKEFVHRLLLNHGKDLPPAVIDADALNTLAGEPEWWRELTGNAILTPHPGEMARLTGKTVEEVQRHRLEIAEDMAAVWNKTVVLKGAYSVIASPEVSSVISPAANPGLASAGTGDVLAGVIAGLAAQGLDPCDAATCGVYLHAEAGEIVKEKLGDTGMTASDLLPELPVAVKKIKNIV